MAESLENLDFYVAEQKIRHKKGLAEALDRFEKQEEGR